MSTSSDILESKLNELKESIPSNTLIRLRRSITWVARAEREHKDPAAAIVFYWIAFNSLYGSDIDPETQVRERELDSMRRFLSLSVKNDQRCLLSECLKSKLAESIVRLVNNKYVFHLYWKKQGVGNRRHVFWQHALAKEAKDLKDDLDANRTQEVLGIVFDRLYLLRCQLIHGNATRREDDHREQISEGCQILASFVPLMFEIVLSAREIDLGLPPYPPMNPHPAVTTNAPGVRPRVADSSALHRKAGASRPVLRLKDRSGS